MKPAGFRELVERVVLAPIGHDRTRITYTMALTPSPALRPLAPLLRIGVGKSLQKAVEALGRKATELPAR